MGLDGTLTSHIERVAPNNLKFKFHNKETSAANHIVRYGVRSELLNIET